jgi:PKD repeat protein
MQVNKVQVKACFSILLFSSLLICNSLFAQIPDVCATDSKVNEALKKSAALRKKFADQMKAANANDLKCFSNGYADERSSSTLYVIPVVFHIIHENGQENVSDAQVHDALRVLNADFRKTNSDTSQLVPVFQPVAADCQMEFRLAQIDPDGNCTNGIDRIYSYQTNIGDDGSKLNPWPASKYYNIWVVKNISPGGIAGYAYYPGTAPFNGEGVVILHNYLGSIGSSSLNNSRVLTHETGHYLNLPHVWGSTNNPGVACGDDGVWDTPITKGWTSCNLNGSFCSSGVIENVQNYMEYSYCTKMFSWGQKARMVNALNSSAGSRNSLWTAANLIATGVNNPAVICVADFFSKPRSVTLCEGESLTFKDMAYNGNPDTWQWTFPGGTLQGTSSVADSTPVVAYNTAGSYDVSLSVSNPTGSASTTKYNYVEVQSDTASFNSNSFSESFESIQLPSNDWVVNDLDGSGTTWQSTGIAASSGSFSAVLSNITSNPGDADELISPSINIAAIQSPYFTFKYAFAPRFAGSADQLIVSVSSDCGKTWFQRKLLSGTVLYTAAPIFSAFTPGPSEWKQSVVSILNMVNKSNVRIRFKFLNDAGNNLYIDDVNIISTLDIAPELQFDPSFTVYPNPLENGSKVSFYLTSSDNVTISISNSLGQLVSAITSQNFSQGAHQLLLDKFIDLESGLYFLNFISSQGRITQKLSIP